MTPETVAVERALTAPATTATPASALAAGAGVATQPKPRVLEGFAGPGGFSEALRLLRIPSIGLELNRNACATAQAAGHHRIRGDIGTHDPADWPHIHGWVSGPPCPTFSAGGRHTGVADLGTVTGAIVEVADQPAPRAVLTTLAEQVTDTRTALVLETLHWALELPRLRWLVAEQVPAVRPIWQEFAAELVAQHRWDQAHVITIRADDLGIPTRRERVFLIARRTGGIDTTGLPTRRHWVAHRFEHGVREMIPTGGIDMLNSPALPAPTMAQALGWPTGLQLYTRGANRRPGYVASCDRPAPSITGKADSWRTSDGRRLAPRDSGLLQGFRHDYPWQGSWTSQGQQAADAVPVPLALAVVGVAARRRWRPVLTRYLSELYPQTAREDVA